MATKQQRSLDDVVFENKNKAYGAYYNRITAGWDLMKSLVLTIFGISVLAVVLSFTLHTETENPEEEPYTYELDRITNPPAEKVKPEVQKEKPVQKPKTLQTDKTNQIPTPKVNPPVQTEVLEHDDLATAVSTDVGEDGIETIVNPNSTDTSGTGGNEDGNAVEDTEENNTVYMVRDVTHMAVFPGCEKFAGNKEKLQSCLSEQLQRELSIQLNDFQETADRQGFHEAVAKVQFIIDKSGKIVEIKTLKGGNASLSKESRDALERISKRMIQKGKLIQPAKFNDGTPVNMMFTIPVKFISN
ncbi:MAG: hypothetical protein WCY25_04740 [Moheibacter sp.]